MKGLIKAGLIGAAGTFVWAQVEGPSKRVTSMFPASIAFLVPFVPGFVAGMAAKKWG